MALVALHRAQFDLNSGIEVEIESVTGKGGALTAPLTALSLKSADEEIDADIISSGGIPPMCWRDGNVLFEAFQLREDTDYFLDVTIPLSITEATERSSIHTAWPLSQKLKSTFIREPIKRWREVERDGVQHTIVTGLLRLRSHAGILDLGTELGGYLRAEVVCRKLHYFDEFKSLLDDLSQKATELLLAYDTPVSLSFDLSQDQVKDDSALHFLMRYVMSVDQLPAAIREVFENPHSQLIEQFEIKPIEEIEEAQAELIVDHIDMTELGNGGPLAQFFGNYTPRELPQQEIFETHDTPENRYTKAFLEHCRLLTQRIEGIMRSRKRKAAEREAKGWGEQIDQLLQHDLWREVGALVNGQLK